MAANNMPRFPFRRKNIRRSRRRAHGNAQVPRAADPFNVAATIIFALAIMHTFAAGIFTKLAHKYEHLHDEALKHRGIRDADHPNGVNEVSFLGTLFHFLGEIEVVFGLWVIVLAGAAIYFHSWLDFELYLSKDREFVEPIFVVIIMAIAASRPVLRFAESAHVMRGDAWQRQPFRMVAERADHRAGARILHHRARGHDHRRAAAGQEILSFQSAGETGLWHAGFVVCQHIDRRHPDELRRAAGADGGQ